MEKISEESGHAWSFSQVKWIACVVDVIVACSTSRQMGNGDESMWGGCTSRVLVFERCGHDLSAGDGANMPSPQDGGWSLRGASSRSRAQSCDFFGV